MTLPASTSLLIFICWVSFITSWHRLSWKMRNNKRWCRGEGKVFWKFSEGIFGIFFLIFDFSWTNVYIWKKTANLESWKVSNVFTRSNELDCRARRTLEGVDKFHNSTERKIYFFLIQSFNFKFLLCSKSEKRHFYHEKFHIQHSQCDMKNVFGIFHEK